MGSGLQRGHIVYGLIGHYRPAGQISSRQVIATTMHQYSAQFINAIPCSDYVELNGGFNLPLAHDPVPLERGVCLVVICVTARMFGQWCQ